MTPESMQPQYPHICGGDLEEIIKHHQQDIRRRDAKWRQYVQWYRGNFHGTHHEARGDQVDQVTGIAVGMGRNTGSDPAMETNYLYAFADAHVSTVVPPNVRIQVKPRREVNRDRARTREGVVNDIFAYNDMTRILWKASIVACLKGVSFLKCWWSMKDHRPLFDVVDATRLYFDPTAKRWADVTYCIEVQDVSIHVIEQKVREGSYRPEAKAWCRKGTGKGARMTVAPIYVLYDFVTGQEAHFADNHFSEPLNLKPIPIAIKGKMANPFFPLTFNESLSDLYGIPDPQLIEGPLRELNQLDTLELRHAVTSIPTVFLNASAFADPEKALALFADSVDPGTVNMLDLAVGQAQTWGSAIYTTQGTTLPHDFRASREKARQSIEYVLALPGFQRGVVGAADLATEVAVAEHGVRTRNGRRQLVVRRAGAWGALQALAVYHEFGDGVAIEYRLSEQDHEGQTATAEDLGLDFTSEEFAFDYDLVVVSPPEEARATRLQALQNALPIFLQSQDIDHRKILRDFLYLMDLPEDRLTPPTPAGGGGMMPGLQQSAPPTNLPPSDLMGMAAGGQIAPQVDISAGMQGTT